ncbi:DUF4328 domain-containing protein [Streptomyces sp. NPDC048338]|uniref:DUF4328 domain-containing protein n=1 Tax=Streptomyces sp. NPDC048338 TaxID=3365536 RepID=UPI003713E369
MRAPLPTAALRSLRGPAAVATVLLVLAGVVNLASAGIGVSAWSMANDLVVDPTAVSEAALDRSDALTVNVGNFQQMALLVTGIGFLVWFHRARVNGEVFQPGGFTQTRGWAIGSWFIPLVHLLLPFRICLQIWMASAPLGPGATPRRVSTALPTAWWALWAGSGVLYAVADQMFKRAEEPEAWRNSLTVGILADALMAASAVLAILFVRKLTAMQYARTSSGPSTAA